MAGWPLFVYPKYFCLQNKPAERRSHPFLFGGSSDALPKVLASHAVGGETGIPNRSDREPLLAKAKFVAIPSLLSFSIGDPYGRGAASNFLRC
jgi:hypothetical protein